MKEIESDIEEDVKEIEEIAEGTAIGSLPATDLTTPQPTKTAPKAQPMPRTKKVTKAI